MLGKTHIKKVFFSGRTTKRPAPEPLNKGDSLNHFFLLVKKNYQNLMDY